MKKRTAFVLLVSSFWFSAAIGSFATYNAEPFFCAIGITILAGIGYLMLS